MEPKLWIITGFSILFMIGILVICIPVKQLSQQKIKRSFLNSINNRIFINEGGKNILPDTGFTITKNKYTLIRYTVFIAFLSLGTLTSSFFIISIAFIFIGISMPNRSFLNKKTPFEKVLSILQKEHNWKKDLEIYDALGYLKNIMMIERENRISSDIMIENLANYSKLLKPTYYRILGFVRTNRKEEAAQYFSEEVKTPTGKNFGRLLIQLDELNLRELEEILISYQRSIREIRITKQKQRDETASDLIYLPVITNIFIIFINFIYVSYFIDQKELFQVFM